MDSILIDTSAKSLVGTPVVLYNNGQNDLTEEILSQLNAGAPTGLQKGDVILSLDGVPVSTIDDVHRFLTRVSPEAAIRVGISRNAQPMTLDVRLTEATAA